MANANTQHKYITLSSLSNFLQNLRKYFKADDSNFGGIKLGYTKDKDDIENKYPVQLNDDGQAFVQVPNPNSVDSWSLIDIQSIPNTNSDVLYDMTPILFNDVQLDDYDDSDGATCSIGTAPDRMGPDLTKIPNPSKSDYLSYTAPYSKVWKCDGYIDWRAPEDKPLYITPGDTICVEGWVMRQKEEPNPEIYFMVGLEIRDKNGNYIGKEGTLNSATKYFHIKDKNSNVDPTSIYVCPGDGVWHNIYGESEILPPSTYESCTARLRVCINYPSKGTSSVPTYFGGVKLYKKRSTEEVVTTDEKVKQNKITIGSSVETAQSFPILTGAVDQDKTTTGEAYFAPKLKLVVGTNPDDPSDLKLGLTGLTNIYSTEFIENGKSLKEKYAAQQADDSNFGGIKLGYTNDGDEKNYPVQLNDDGKAFVKVPWEAGSAIKIQIVTTEESESEKISDNKYNGSLKADTAIYLDNGNAAMDEIIITKFVDSDNNEINTETGGNDPRVITFSLIYRSKIAANSSASSTQLKFPNNVDIKWANGYRLWNGDGGTAVKGIVELVITCIPQLSLYTASWIQYL